MSSQVGSGHIAIFPVMTGFKAAVSKAVQGAGKTVGSDFSSAMKGAGQKIGSALGSDMKGAFSKSASDLGTQSLSKLNRDVASAASSLSAARLKQQDAAGQVRVAETKLAEVLKKSGEGSSQAVAAQEKLASAQRKAAAAGDVVAAASTKLKTAQSALKDGQNALSASTDQGVQSQGRLKGALAAGAQMAQSAASSIGGAASNIGSAIKSGVETAATTAVAAAGVALAALGTQMVSVAKQSVAAYADWEQAVGGIDTLFKGSSGTVQQYAADAYKTAGVSANDYMSQITSFSASLIGSLGGDTAKAAELGNTAMIDMSDNANKMGTDISSIQQTYQSLARGNYAMLDNLKLGYGGTKTEMERLLSDAEKLSGQKYDIGNFSDVVSAIHVVQGELGITGTTAEEASKTITGSIGMTKAAWANWLAELGKDNADIEGKSSELMESLGAMIGNILPRVKQVVKGMISSLPSLFEGLKGLLPDGVQSAIDAVSSKAEGLKAVLAPLTGAFVALGSAGLGGVLSNIPLVGGQLGGLAGILTKFGGPVGIAAAALAGFALSGGDAEAMASGFGSIVDGIVGMLPGMVDAIVQAVPAMLTGLLGALPALLSAGPQIVQSLIEGIVTALPIIITGAVDLVTALLTGIVQMLPMIITSGIDLVVSLITGLLQALPQVLAAAIMLVTGLLQAIISNLPQLIQAGIQLILSLINGIISILPQLITTAITLVIQLVSGLISMLPQIIAAGVQLIIGLVSGLVQAIPQIIAAVPQIVSAIKDGVRNVDWGALGSQLVQGIASGIRNGAGAIMGAAREAASNALQSAKDFLKIHSPSRRARDEIGKQFGAGFALGIDDSSGLVEGSAEDIAKRASIAAKATAALSFGVLAAGRSAAAQSESVASKTTNNTFVVPDPAEAAAYMRMQDQIDLGVR